jgi:uncharacterized protein (TIGR00269 family)
MRRRCNTASGLGFGVKCDKCDADAVIDQPYRRAHLCGEHLRESVRERARREFHRQLPRASRGTIAIALSGGKDSAVALDVAHRYFGRRPTVRLVAVSADEGIAGYRSHTLERAGEYARSLGVEHRVVRAEEKLGTTTDRAAARLSGLPPCSFCGVWRRSLLNRVAREVGADALVLGFNLDDLAQTVLMNLVRAELPRLARMAPHRTRRPGLVPRVAPLASVPEREVFLYARLSGISFDHGECPHAAAAARNVYRDALWRLEEAFPGTRQSLMRTREALLPLLLGRANGEEPGRCVECGEPAAGIRCRSCEYLLAAAKSFIPAAGSSRP